MSELTASASVATHRLRDLMIAGFVVGGALLILYLVLLSQGIYLHEFNHDGRHMFAANCH